MIFWHNPRCSKSRQALALLQDRGAQIEIRKYLDDSPSATDLRALQTKLGVKAIDMMRSKEKAFRDMGLSRDTDDATLLEAMAKDPRLIERPVLITATRAVIGRPPERVLELL